MKKYIDYFFWKRTWFRIGFILFPTWAFIFLIFAPYSWVNWHYTKDIICFVYLISIVAAIMDNKCVNGPDNPFVITKDGMACYLQWYKRVADVDQRYAVNRLMAHNKYLLTEAGGHAGSICFKSESVYGLTDEEFNKKFQGYNYLVWLCDFDDYCNERAITGRYYLAFCEYVIKYRQKKGHLLS